MIDPELNYRHLLAFWAVAKAGGVVRGAARLGVAPQTVSAQLQALERALGLALLKPAGRSLALTDAGRAVAAQADQIFQLGAALPALAREAAGAPRLRLVVGAAEGLAKLVVQRLLAPVATTPGLQLVCHEGPVDRLLADLALHRLDLVLADRPAPPHASLRLFSHTLAGSAVAWYGVPALAARARADFPAALARLPLLLPGPQTALRPLLERWFERQGLHPQPAGEFDDSALMKTFAAEGLGLFPACTLVEPALAARYGVERAGPCDGVDENHWAIVAERRVQHPLVQRLLGGREG